jgi:hypothetical protein
VARDKLNQIWEQQRAYQLELGNDLDNMTPKERISYVLSMSYALEDEIHESTKEVGWKPWASSRHFNTEAYRSELIDCFFFLVNLMMAAGMKPLDLWRGYQAKLKKNLERVRGGYDGVSTKCPHCKRDYNDSGVVCRPGIHVDEGMDRRVAARILATISSAPVKGVRHAA